MNLTIGAWVLFVIIALVIIFIGVSIGFANADGIGAVVGLVIGIILSIIILFAMNWYYSNTASGARAIKTQESNFNKGINREVKVYDATGNLIKEYEGKFDIDYDDDRIIFDDENGLRHIIYYPTGTVIIDEVSQ